MVFGLAGAFVLCTEKLEHQLFEALSNLLLFFQESLFFFLFFLNTAHCEWICSFAVFGEGLYFMSGEIKALPCLSDKENILAFTDEAT